jgi:hypothetical protein
MLLYETPQGLRRAAYDGELVDVVFRSPVDEGTIDQLNQAIEGRTLERIDSRTVRLVVDDAGTAGPAITRWGENQSLDIEESEAYVASFDDVFVEVVEKYTGNPRDSGGPAIAHEKTSSER